MKMVYYIEMKDVETEEIADIYGYKDRITVWAPGFFKEYKSEGIADTRAQMDEIERKLKAVGYVTINKEDKTEGAA